MNRRTAVVACVLVTAAVVRADDVVKANNSNYLNTASSWTNGVVPGANDIAVWTSLATGAGTVTNGGNLAWGGLRVDSTAPVLTIRDGGSAVTLTLGTGGVSTAKGLTFETKLATAGDQVWSSPGDASGVTAASHGGGTWFTMGLYNGGHGITGSDTVTLRRASGTANATFVLRPGSSGSVGFNDANANSGFSGRWVIETGVLARVIRNGASAWGTGVIELAGGAVAPFDGNWTWTTRMETRADTTSVIDNRNTGGSGRYLKLQGEISGAGGLTFTDTGSGMANVDYGFILTGSNTLSGAITVAGGAELRVGGVPGQDTTTGAGVGGSLGSGVVTNSGLLTFARSNGHTVSNRISGAGVVRIGSSGLAASSNQFVVLSGASDYTGGTVINVGTAQLANASGVGRSGSYGGAVTNRNGTFDLNGQMNYTNANQSGAPGTWLTAATLVLGGVAGGTPSVIDSAASPKGIALANATALVYESANNPGTATMAARWTQSGTTAYGTRQLNVGDSTTTAIEVDFTGGLGDLNARDGFRTTVQKSGAGTVRISAANAFPGLRVTAGRLVVNHAQALGADRSSEVVNGTTGMANVVTVDGGILDLNGFSVAAGALSDGGLATGIIENNGGGVATLTVGSSVSNSVYAGTLRNGTAALALTKVGSNPLNLTGTNSYSGATTVSNGALLVNGAYTGGGLITVYAGGVLGGTGTVSGVSVAGGIYAPGNSPGIQTSAALAIDGGTLALDIWGAGGAGAVDGYDRVVLLGGGLTLGGAPVIEVNLNSAYAPGIGALFTVVEGAGSRSGSFAAVNVVNAPAEFAGRSFDVAYGAGDVTLTVVPEPGTLGVGCVGALMAFLMRHRLRRGTRR